MSSTPTDISTSKTEKQAAKQQPWWAIPATLSMILISSGIFFVLLAYGISILSTVPY